jgi:hypothetical protein
LRVDIPGYEQHLMDGPIGVVEAQGERLIVWLLHVVAHLLDVRLEISGGELADVVLGKPRAFLIRRGHRCSSVVRGPRP